MDELECALDQDNSLEENQYKALLILTSFAFMSYGFIRLTESTNKLQYESRLARVVAGTLKLVWMALHASKDPYEIITNNPGEGKLITVGPHKTGLVDGVSIGSVMEGNPPLFLATDSFNKLPGLPYLMKKFETIIVKANREEREKSNSGGVIKQASEAIKNKGCVVLFPQGNFCRINQEVHKIYDGAAKIALETNKPIHVLRLDGFLSLENSLLPVFIKDHSVYRAFLSFFHVNNMKLTSCRVIDFHLKDENKDLPEADKIFEINSQLFAYYSHKEELTPKQIKSLDTKITNNIHHSFWNNKLKQVAATKEMKTLKAEQVELEQTHALTS